MGVKLPPLTTRLDASEMAEEYAGIEIELRVNPPWPDYEEPDVETLQAEPWRTTPWALRARAVKAVWVPEPFLDGAELGGGWAYVNRDGTRWASFAVDYDPERLYRLESDPEWDPRITAWATAQFFGRRGELFEARLKN